MRVTGRNFVKLVYILEVHFRQYCHCFLSILFVMGHYKDHLKWTLLVSLICSAIYQIQLGVLSQHMDKERQCLKYTTVFIAVINI